MKRLLSLVLSLCLSTASLYAQTPNLVVSAGPTGQAATLTISSDSANPWKCFTVSGGSGQYNVIWAESTGTSGGIYFGTIATSCSGAAGPVAPPQNDLPLATLTTAVTAALSGVDAATAATVANSYETIAKAVDAGTIVSPLQLQLATSAQLLGLTADQLTACNPFITAVNGWIDGQQCTGKLTPDRMDRYARTYHAIAQAVKPGTITARPATKPKLQIRTPKPVAAHGEEIECPCPEHPKTAIVSVPVPAACPHTNGACTATVYDYTSKPPAGEAPKTQHLLKSVSPCGCVVKIEVCDCIANGTYTGKCTASADGMSSLCRYEIGCSPSEAPPKPAGKSPCADGHCPYTEQPAWRVRRR